MEISNNTLALFLIAAVVISVGGTIVSLNRLNTLSQITTTTGFASANSTGTTMLNISTTSAIRFAINAVDFGAGSVNTTAGGTNCTMWINDSSTFNKSGCTSFNTVNPYGDTFILENDGSTYLNVTLNSTNNTADFIGGNVTVAAFEYVVGNNQSGSCVGTLGLTTWAYVLKVDTNICSNMSYNVAFNTLRIGVKVIIPYDAGSGARSSIFTATGVGY